MNKISKILVLSVLITVGLSSCNALLKSFLGVKDADIYVSTQDRNEYYKGMINDVNYGYTIRTFSDSTKLLNTFKEGLSMPMLLLKDLDKNQLYNLNCYEDIEYQVELVNSGIYTKLDKANNEVREKIDDFLINQTNVVVDKSENLPKKNLVLYYVSGTFMGKKLQKRVNKIKYINNINNLNIIDLSVNNQ